MRFMSIQIAPSILSADFANLERDLRAISTADMVHVDVMDHHFVPNLTLGEPVVERICQVTDLPVDVHLMIEDPDRWAPEFAKLGVASVTFHTGAVHAPVRLARQLHNMGVKACLAVRPAEPVEPIFDILEEFDMILVMTVEPGFGGQKFLDNQMAKTRRLRNEIAPVGWERTSRWMAGSAQPRPPSSPRPEPMSWWRVQPSMGRMIRPRPSTRSGGPPRNGTGTDRSGQKERGTMTNEDLR